MQLEIAMYLNGVLGGLSHIVEALDGLDDETIRWKPLPTTNCLAVIAKHSLANAERNVLAHFAGQPYEYNRDEEFIADEESSATLRAEFERLRDWMRTSLEPMEASALERMCSHVRLGEIPGRAVLLQAARHAAEHVGEAILTRELVDGREG